MLPPVVMDYLRSATLDEVAELLGHVSVDAQRRANDVAPNDVQLYRAWLRVRDNTNEGAETVLRVKRTANMPKKFCIGCGDNHPVGGCP